MIVNNGILVSHHPIFELNTMKFRLIFGAFSETRMIMIYMQLVVSWILTGIQLVIAEKRNSSRSMLLLFVFIFKLEYFAVIIWNTVCFFGGGRLMKVLNGSVILLSLGYPEFLFVVFFDFFLPMLQLISYINSLDKYWQNCIIHL